jgi:hypothetical protein
MNKVATILFLAFLFTQHYVAADNTYAAVMAGKECQESSDQSLSCSYKVGESLHIEVAGIGSPDTGIAFLQSDIDGDYYGKYGMLHGCVVISATQEFSMSPSYRPGMAKFINRGKNAAVPCNHTRSAWRRTAALLNRTCCRIAVAGLWRRVFMSRLALASSASLAERRRARDDSRVSPAAQGCAVGRPPSQRCAAQ